MGGGSEADFMIHGIMKYHLFGQELWITTTTVGMTIITIVLLILAFAANRAMKHATEVPGTFQNILELGVEMLEKMTQGILGHRPDGLPIILVRSSCLFCSVT